MKSFYPNVNTFLPLTIFVVSFVLLTGCNNPDQKNERTTSAVVEAGKDLQNATLGVMAEINQFRQEAATKMSAIDSTITVFKANLANETGEMKADSEKQLAVLEQNTAN